MAGRPRKVLDPKKIETMAAVGSPASEIAAVLGCNEKTIERNFGTVLKRGQQKCCHTVRSQLFKHVRAGNVVATIFLAKALLGLKENPDTVINVSATATGGSITISDEQKKELSRMARFIRHQAFVETGASHNGSNGDPASN